MKKNDIFTCVDCDAEFSVRIECEGVKDIQPMYCPLCGGFNLIKEDED